MSGNFELSWKDIDKSLESFALDPPDKFPKFRITERMRRGIMPGNSGCDTKDLPILYNSILHYINEKNYRMLLAFMNCYGYSCLDIDIISHIPLEDLVSVFPLGSFEYCGFIFETNMDLVWKYKWLYSSTQEIIDVIIDTAVCYEANTLALTISKMDDLKKEPLAVFKAILENKIYQDIFIYDYPSVLNNYKRDSQRRPVRNIKKNIVDVISQLVKLLDPYLSFYDANRAFARIAFLPWTLPWYKPENHGNLTDRHLKPFQTNVFDFGIMPIWSKAIHVKYPSLFREQVLTVLMIRKRKGNNLNRYFLKDLQPLLFQFMAFNSLIKEKENIITHYEEFYETEGFLHDDPFDRDKRLENIKNKKAKI